MAFEDSAPLVTIKFIWQLDWEIETRVIVQVAVRVRCSVVSIGLRSHEVASRMLMVILVIAHHMWVSRTRPNSRHVLDTRATNWRRRLGGWSRPWGTTRRTNGILASHGAIILRIISLLVGPLVAFASNATAGPRRQRHGQSNRPRGRTPKTPNNTDDDLMLQNSMILLVPSQYICTNPDQKQIVWMICSQD